MQVTRERHEVKRPGYSCERPGRRVLRCIGIWTHPATAEKQAEIVLPVVLARLESSTIFRSVCPNLDKVSLFCVAQVVAQLAEGFALRKDADSTT